MNRRDVLLGGGLLAAAAGAEYLRPRDRLILLPDGRKLEDIVPQTIGTWQRVEAEGFVLPKKTPGTVADKLYNQILTRLYQSTDQIPIMLVVAYGATQNDALQLHRPEVCYTAVGFQITESNQALVSLSDAAKLPVRELTARSDARIEPILYWTRIGDDLPTTGREQRQVKLQQQMRGYLADGVLVRVSTVADPTPEVFAAMGLFARTMMNAMAVKDRPAFIGRPLSSKMS